MGEAMRRRESDLDLNREDQADKMSISKSNSQKHNDSMKKSTELLLINHESINIKFYEAKQIKIKTKIFNSIKN